MTLPPKELFQALNLPQKTLRLLHRLRQTEGSERFRSAVLETTALFPDSKKKATEQETLCAKHNIDWLTIEDPRYPIALKETPEAPLVLFYKGQIETLLKEPQVAIVGSRNANPAGLAIAESCGSYLSARGACVVSGLALGADAAAHRGALADGKAGSTVAVLAHGLDSLYPRTNQRLAEQIIAQEGVLVSQFPPSVKPYPQQFLMRNLVIAGLARCTLVIQAGKRSGSLVTARIAFECGRDVCAIPGFPGDPRHLGTNKLIQDGAHLINSAEELAHIVDGLQEPAVGEQPNSHRHLSSTAKDIISVLTANGRSHYSEIHEATGNTSRFHSELLQLQLDGIVFPCGGNQYDLCKI